MSATRTPAALTLAVLGMFVLSAYQLLQAQKPQYVPDIGDDAGATCCIGREACEVEEHPPAASCFYATDHGALPTWYECVAPICDAWAGTTCWADAAKARHEMGWGGAYEACDYDPRAAATIASQCFKPEAGDSCVGEQFHACVADRCRVWDGSARNCEKDADDWAHKLAEDCGSPTAASAGPYAPLLESLDFADRSMIAFADGVRRAAGQPPAAYHVVKAAADRQRLLQLNSDAKSVLQDIDAYIKQPSPTSWLKLRPRFREITRAVDVFATQLWNEGVTFIPEDVGRKLQNRLNDPALIPAEPAAPRDQEDLSKLRGRCEAIQTHIEEAISALNNLLKKAGMAGG